MADFFGKLKQTIDKSAKVITAKSASAIDTTKIKNEIANLGKQKNDYFLKIGKAVYAASEGQFELSSVAEELQLLKNCDADIAIKEQELERIKQETEEKLQQINEAYQEPAATVDAGTNDSEPVEVETDNEQNN